MWKYSAKAKGFHYWPPKFNSKDLAFVFVLEVFVLFLSLKQEMEQEMDNIFLKKNQHSASALVFSKRPNIFQSYSFGQMWKCHSLLEGQFFNFNIITMNHLLQPKWFWSCTELSLNSYCQVIYNSNYSNGTHTVQNIIVIFDKLLCTFGTFISSLVMYTCIRCIKK